MSTELQVASKPLQLSVKSLPDLAKAEESIISFSPEYLDVDALEKGWSMRCFYLGIQDRSGLDVVTGEIKNLRCVLLAAQEKEGIKVYESAARTLVGTLEEKEKRGLITPKETALKITFLGKKKNKTNQFSSSKWDIRLLYINAPTLSSEAKAA